MEIQGTRTLLSYARNETERLPNSVIIVERSDNCVRFIDPPSASFTRTRRLLAWVIFQFSLAFTVAIVLCIVAGMGVTYAVEIASAVALVQVWMRTRWWSRSRYNPTIIDVFSDFITLRLPMQKPLAIPLKNLNDIHARKPWRFPFIGGRASSLRISWGHRAISIFQLRDYIEIRWFASQLRIAVGRDEIHHGEPALTKIDEQVEPSSVLPVLLTVPLEMRGTVEKPRLFARFWHGVMGEYERMNGGPFLVLVALVVVGNFFLVRWARIATICLQFGFHTFGDPSFRPVPHRAAFLMNGKRIDAIHEFLMFVIFAPAMALWIATALLITTGINRILTPWYVQRLKRKMDRICVEHIRVKAEQRAVHR